MDVRIAEKKVQDTRKNRINGNIIRSTLAIVLLPNPGPSSLTSPRRHCNISWRCLKPLMESCCVGSLELLTASGSMPALTCSSLHFYRKALCLAWWTRMRCHYHVDCASTCCRQPVSISWFVSILRDHEEISYNFFWQSHLLTCGGGSRHNWSCRGWLYFTF